MLISDLDFLLLSSEGLLKVTVLLDEGLHTVQRVTQVVIDQESLLLGHPGVGLLRVTQEQLQVHALLVEHAALLPQLQESVLLMVQGLQLTQDQRSEIHLSSTRN